ncbi:hypothetical protein BVX97_04805 [bacterium E08(2017)]|nr:hypothetical protein BVX97_04805 [bacterium E08(2017)]
MQSQKTYIGIIAVSVMTTTVCLAGKSGLPNFSRKAELPNIGLSIRMLTGGKATPLSPPSVYTYTYTQGETSWTEERYEPRALWYSTQHAGRWKDEHGNVLTLAKVSMPLLKNLQSKHVTRDRYISLVNAVFSEQPEWTDAELRDWVADFTETSSVKSQRISVNSTKIKDVVQLQFKNPRLLAYAFKLNPAAFGQRDATTQFFFVSLALNASADPNKSAKILISTFLNNIAVSKQRGTGNIAARKDFQINKRVSLSEKRNNPEKSAEFIESRAQVANSIRNLKNWWYVDTENYIILSNLSLSHKTMVKELQHDIEYLRNAYAKLVPAKQEISAVSVIRVFADPNEYISYVGPERKWTAGLWMPSKKEMVIKPIDWGGKSQQRKTAKRIVFHEAFHQYLHYALGQVHASVWFNEGHAELFGYSQIKNERLELIEDEYAVETLTRMIAAGRADTHRLLNMDYEEFYGKSDQQRTENYALAWAIVYYLTKGASLDKPANNKDILNKYIDALWNTKDRKKATEIAFNATNHQNFQNDFLKFWQSKSKRSSARRNKIFK